ncbi:hypothetical protein Tco_0954949 [Tanacetum coccineum]|uniref:Retrotransposon gag protein n=1 Tax=Tanacetum coccineum TaxID=301880 RepID=A0ABQ5E5T1_9ASTR
MEEMMTITTVIIRGETAAASIKKGHAPWKPHDQPKRHFPCGNLISECMTKSSNKELVEPYNEIEQVLYSLRELSKTTSFDHSSSPEFKLFYDHERKFEEEITEIMTEPTMEDGSENEDANEHIEIVLVIVDLFTTPDVTQDQLMLRVFPITLTGAASRWLRNEPANSITT